MTRLMDYEWLRTTSQQAEQTNDKQVGRFTDVFVPAIDCLLKFPHWMGIGPKASVYTGWAMGAYVNAPYTFAAACRLSRSGFYLEASMLLRHLSEVLVQLAYFSSRPQDAVNHFIPVAFQNMKPGDPLPTEMPKLNKVQFRQMFDAFAPGYYRQGYALASTFAHGALGSHLFRIDDTVSPPQLEHGCNYDDATAMSVINQAFAWMHGFLFWFPQVFPTWITQAATALRDQQLASMKLALDTLWQESPQSHPWLTSISMLIGWSEPVP